MMIRDARIDSGKAFDWGRTSVEELDLPKGSFDVITACQCFWYFDHRKVMPILSDLLREDGRLLILYMA
ncbi:MAG: class I SAM-dependent methyltransferase, partial [Lachnospiraceae bacterium]|nr:class I SAM-dependent methyltransferase [Lachnospiraceae bacterium]